MGKAVCDEDGRRGDRHGDGCADPIRLQSYSSTENDLAIRPVERCRTQLANQFRLHARLEGTGGTLPQMGGEAGQVEVVQLTVDPGRNRFPSSYAIVWWNYEWNAAPPSCLLGRSSEQEVS